ncbi:MAG: hypothetical protein IKB13_07465 [Clostridia bacterium]|nr:hypothetical protein [Clostridia bacterium]
MKKTLIIILSLVLCLSCAACGADPLTKACTEADALVSQWHKEAYGGCIYKGEYIEQQDGYKVSMYVVSARYPSYIDNEASATFVKNLAVGRLRDELYPQLREVFKDLDVSVAFILSDERGNNTYCTILDGEIEYMKK